MKLSSDYKIETARTLTELAIQNDLIPKYADEIDAAKAVAIFFKTLHENLDDTNQE